MHTMNLKCLTAFVWYVNPGSIPASSRARASSRPAGPTNCSPAGSSRSPVARRWRRRAYLASVDAPYVVSVAKPRL